MPKDTCILRLSVKDKNDRYIKAPRKAYNQVNLSKLKVISHNHNWLTGALVPIGK